MEAKYSERKLKVSFHRFLGGERIRDQTGALPDRDVRRFAMGNPCGAGRRQPHKSKGEGE
jgi:hypothetical protein